MLAYNSTVHAALSQGHCGISPAELFLGRRIRVAPAFDGELDTAEDTEVHTGEIKQNVLKALEWVEECKEKYEEGMKGLIGSRD